MNKSEELLHWGFHSHFCRYRTGTVIILKKALMILLAVCLLTSLLTGVLAEGHLEGKPWVNPELPGERAAAERRKQRERKAGVSCRPPSFLPLSVDERAEKGFEHEKTKKQTVGRCQKYAAAQALFSRPGVRLDGQ